MTMADMSKLIGKLSDNGQTGRQDEGLRGARGVNKVHEKYHRPHTILELTYILLAVFIEESVFNIYLVYESC